MTSHACAEKPIPVNYKHPDLADPSARADWSAYAKAYDLLTQHNPEYQMLLQDFEAFLATIDTPKVVYDLGGGTGNYTEIAARLLPDSEVRLVEPDAGMIGAARAKLATFGNVTFDTVGLQDFDAPGTADLIVSVHSLYAMPGQEERLRDMRRLLRPGGLLYLIDLGRYMNVADWRGYLFSHLRKERGLIGALKIFWQGREIAKQNAAILEAQKKGAYWTHSAAEIAETVTAAGFKILRQDAVYRGYSDLLVCEAQH